MIAVKVGSPASSSAISSHTAARRLFRDTGARLALGLLAVVVLSAIFAPLIAPYPLDAENASHLDQRLRPPGLPFLFGTDHLGRDVFSRALFGGRVSLEIGAISVFLSALLGTALGLTAGYGPGWLEELIMRISDVFLGIPSLVLAVLVSITLGGGIESATLAIAATAWPRYTRLVRGEVLRVRVLEFVEAARACGVPPVRIVLRHILPGVQPVLSVQAAVQVGSAILVAAALGFIGLGARPPSPEWGLSIAIGREYLPEAWWIGFFPGACIFATVFAASLFSDAIQRALDIRLSNR
jgi:peptide/nickel transport system permease protein